MEIDHVPLIQEGISSVTTQNTGQGWKYLSKSCRMSAIKYVLVINDSARPTSNCQRILLNKKTDHMRAVSFNCSFPTVERVIENVEVINSGLYILLNKRLAWIPALYKYETFSNSLM